MTVDQPQASVVVDTSVFSYFAAQAPLGDTYRELLAGRTIALSFFVKTELDGRDWDELRRARLDALYQYCVYLEPTEATSNWYNAAHRRRREMRLALAIPISGSSPTPPSTTSRTCRTIAAHANWRGHLASTCSRRSARTEPARYVASSA